MKTIATDGGSRAQGRNHKMPYSRLMRAGTCCCLAVLICWTSALSLGQNKPFTNDDVLKMVKAGFGEETILEAIRANEPRFDTSAEGLLALKNAGVSEKIINEMLTASRSRTNTAANTSGGSGETGDLPREIGVYVLKDGRYAELEIEAVDWRSKFFSPVTTSGSLTKSRLTARMDSPESRLQLSGKTEFLIVCPEGVSAQEYHLLRADQGKDKREFRVEFNVLNRGVLLALGGAGKSAVKFDAEKVATAKFRVKPSSLEKGEYAFMPPGTAAQPGPSLAVKMYTFGIR